MDRKWWTLVAVCIGTFMLLLDITVVMVVLPDVQRGLGATLSDLQWVVDAYALTLAALLLTAGSLADQFGRRRLYVIGIALFSLASLLCGLADSPLFLILARSLQGIGGAIMFATALALLGNTYSGHDRGIAFAVWGALTGIAVGVGPIVGGALTELLSWRWIFYVNVPVAAVAVIVALRRTPESRDPHPAAVDWPGVVTFSTALAALILGLIRGNPDGWDSTLVLTSLIAAPVLLVLFVAAERRSRAPMFDLALFRKPAFTGAAAAAFAVSASILALLLYLVIYLQSVLGHSPLGTGLRLLTFSGGVLVFGALSGRLSEHVPARVPMTLGLVLVGVGLLLMRGLDASSDWTALLAGLITAGAGAGLVNPPLASTAVDVVESRRAGMGSGINTTFRQVGIATGIAALGAVFQSSVRASVTAGLAHVPGLGVEAARHAAEAISSGQGAQTISALPPHSQEAAAHVARAAFTGALNELFAIGAVVAFVGAVLTLLLVRSKDLVTRPSERPGASRATASIA
jgi:EmrB/QacA subfamily drug resistance transporter